MSEGPPVLPEKARRGALLGDLTEAEIQRLLARSKSLAFGAGETLLTQGDEGTSMLLLIEGSVELHRDGRLLGTQASGDVVGEMALIDPAPRVATAIASAKGHAYSIEYDYFTALVDAHEPVAIKSLRAISGIACDRLQRMNELVQEVAIGPSKKGVLQRLWSKLSKRR